VALLFTIYQISANALDEKIYSNQQRAISWLNSLYEKANLPDNWHEYFENFNLKYADANLQKKVLQNGEILQKQETQLGRVEVRRLNGELFLTLKNRSAVFVLQNTLQNNSALPLLFCLFACLGLIGLAFASVYQSLKPLKELREDISKFASGNFEDSCRILTKDRKDEIGQVAYEFNSAACKIKDLLCSRQTFLRAIMHELKTPVGKGRILSEMLEDEVAKERFVKIFSRLNELINEFAKVEKIVSKNYNLTRDLVESERVLNGVKDALMLDDFSQKVSVSGGNFWWEVDFELFVLAVKNLVDNALKYSTDKSARIEFGRSFVSVKNKGAALKHDFSYYKEAFVREKSGTQDGLGLGLYIIDKICEMHGFGLLHSYTEGTHEIRIEMNSANLPKGKTR